MLARQPRALIARGSGRISPELEPAPCRKSRPSWRSPPMAKLAAITSARGVWLVDSGVAASARPVLARRFRRGRSFASDGKLLIAANRGAGPAVSDRYGQRSGGDASAAAGPAGSISASTQDGGQLFVTGEGMDGVVIVYPYQTEIAETVLAGHAPGAMAVSDSLLFVASPQSGDVSILEIDSRKVIAVVPVGTDPGAVVVTPDNRYALVLNRKSGDVAVLRASTAATKRFSWTLLTVIPVGERPVSAAVRAV